MRRIAVSIALVSLASAGCPAEREVKPGQRVAIELLTPEGEPREHPLPRITQAEVELELARKRLERAGSLSAKKLPQKLREYTDNALVDRRLLAIEAERLGVKASTTAVAKEMAALKADHDDAAFARMLIQTYQTQAELEAAVTARLTALELLKQQALKSIDVSDADVKARFEALPEEERVQPERVHARQIMVATEQEAEAIHKQLVRKKDEFPAIARQKSIAPEASRGGDVGWFARGQMPRVFDEMCFPLEPGEISPVMASELGYHICQLLEREPAAPLTLEQAAPRLRRELRVEAEREAKAEYLDALRKRVKVRFSVDNEGSGE